jgi:hypothetical protein
MTIEALKLDHAYLCGDLICRTISNLHICPKCGSTTMSLARVLGRVLSAEKGRAA